MGVLELVLTLRSRKGRSSEMLAMIRWILRWGMGTRPPFNECLPPSLQLSMNILAWNCKGALKPNFQSHVHDLV